MRLNLLICLFTAYSLPAQQAPADLDRILARLDRLESENQKLLEEVRALRKELTAGSAPLPERVEVLERRGEEVDQAKVEASQRFPLAITGMALFNAFSNGPNASLQDPLSASLNTQPRNTGATFRQTIVGLRFNGPGTFWGGKVTGAVDFDLWGGDSSSLNHLLRLRTATVRLDWKNTSVSVAQDKPLISPRDPDSLAQVSYSPLTGAGNPWLWQPQARLERRFTWNETYGVRLQGSLYQTREQLPTLPATYDGPAPSSRPGWEGRAEFWKKWNESVRVEFATGFHASDSRVLGQTVPSRIVSLDWLIAPAAWWEISGAYYHGRNLAPIGGAGAGISALGFYQGAYELQAIHQNAGWVQSSWKLAPKWKLNLFAGDLSNRAADLAGAGIKNNLAWGGNLMYRLAPNVITSFETLQLRTDYLGNGMRLNNHYDLALAYLF